jgi:hypothetical protein
MYTTFIDCLCLVKVQVPIWKNGDCLNALGKNVFETSLCAGGREKAADACQVKRFDESLAWFSVIGALYE